MDVRLILKRVATVGLGAMLSVALLTALLGWLALQAEWELPDPAALNTPTVVYDRNGGVIARFTSEQDRRFVRIEDVADVGWQAVVASEDIRFFEHTGVDVTALVRAVVRNVLTGEIEQGGSTLTQQYVRNGLEGVGRERTIVRKVKEAVMSVQLERTESKQDILERYLNTVYFGEGAYGIEAAALTFFDVSSSELSAKQSAMLAQALPSPSQRNPRTDPDGAAARAERVLDNMVLAGFLTEAQADAAKREDVTVRPRQAPSVTYPYFVQYVRQQLEANYGREQVLTGGLQVQTTIDPDVQTAIEEAIAEELPPQEGPNADVDAGVVVLDPRTGQILGSYGGRDFADDNADLALQSDRPNGSTFKPITFVTALEQGIPPTEPYPAPREVRIPASECRDHSSEARTSGAAPGGRIPMREGLIRSINTVMLQVACDVGGPAIVETAHRIGVRNDIGANPAVALGTPCDIDFMENPDECAGRGTAGGASVLDLASAFGTLANDGIYCPARSVLRVRSALGTKLDAPTEVTTTLGARQVPRTPTDEELEARPQRLAARDRGRCYGALEADVARVTTQALQEVVARTTGRRADIGRPQAGKTGTTNQEVDAWFVGYTPDIAIAVWVGHRYCGDPANPDCRLRNIEGFGRVQGGTIPALIWKNIAERVLVDVPPNTFLEPGELAESGRRRPGPAYEPPSPSPTEEPSPSESPTPSEEPTTDGGATDGGDDDGTSGPGLPTTGGDDSGDDGGDDGGCIPLISC